MPEFWYGRSERDVLNARGGATSLADDTNNLGLLGDDGGPRDDDGSENLDKYVWLPWLKLGGGSANGYLWLKFNNDKGDGVVIDVSPR